MSDGGEDKGRGASGAPAMPGGFTGLLLGTTAAEDLAPLPAETREALARGAWTHLAAHRPGRHDLVIRDVVMAGGGGRPVTVVEAANDDMPFLLDSIMGALSDLGCEVRLVAHPILRLSRDAGGTLIGLAAEGDEAARRESLIHIHVDQLDAAAREALAGELDRTLGEVRRATSDWIAMRERIAAAARDLAERPPPSLAPAEASEAAAFLRWLAEDNFTFLGLRDHVLVPEGAGFTLEPVADGALGILRDPALEPLRRGTESMVLTPQIQAFLGEPVPLIVTKASERSRVHRRVYLDYVGIKRFDAAGRLAGEIRLVGLFTSTAYTRSASAIPLLRSKVEAVVARARLDPGSHSGKALVNVLETFPRDELFQIDTDTLARFAADIVTLYDRPRLRVLHRLDEFDRFASILVFVPRDKYSAAVRGRIGDWLAETFGGRLSASYPAFLDGVPLTRVQYIIGRRRGERPDLSREALETGVAARVQTWRDRLGEVLAAQPQARALFSRWGAAFGAGYEEAFPAETARDDIAAMERLSPEHPVALDFRRREGDPDSRVTLKLLAHERGLSLSRRVPVLENLGFRVLEERTFRIQPEGADAAAVWLHEMELEHAGGAAVDLAAAGRLEELLLAIGAGRAESDGFNALALEAGFTWREVAIVRAMGRFLRQTQIPFSQDYIWGVAVRHAAISRLILSLFQTRFDPHGAASPEARATAEAEITAKIEAALAGVQSLDEDRILRRFVNLVSAAVRTNVFQPAPDDDPNPVVSFKFESRRLDGLPAPRPLYEIFVYSPRVEAGHLRFGQVARGGIRWSDRPQDFRTEMLGLAKTQQVKNAVIVPVGAKGAFVPKRLPAGPGEAVAAEGVATYRIFIDAMLDITDNIEGGKVVPPADTVRHDVDDPYLVVAADKGTARYSDTANEIAAGRGYWLDDAFASGGSAGYDHKGIAITSRGAWEAVKRHFREMDIDVQTTPFTVAGVGDMSGDVFGNGMLRSDRTRLVAAFDHRDIFIDPDPDPAASFAERQRLFDLPRSSWADYDRALISRGGGVFPRSAKAVPLSSEARALLGIDAAEADPASVMRAILNAKVDLLWFGGIGTYVRAADEPDAAVGDRANDPIRTTGAEVRATVIGEGANLGMTQRGRIEAANRGIRLNTDAIDNSAGVNASDIEVNIKIAFSPALREGRLKREDRNALLHEMTGEVATLVLRNNYRQTLAVSLSERRGLEHLGFERRLIRVLEERGLLDRRVEALPDDAALAERQRQRQKLTRPEQSVLIAYAKLTLYDDLLGTDVPDDPYLGRELQHYFPTQMRERFAPEIENHQLRREIISTMLASSIVDRGGPSLVVRLADQTGAEVAAIARAFALVHDSFRLDGLNGALDVLDTKISGALQLDLYASVQDILVSRMVWFLRNVETGGGLAQLVARFRDGADAVRGALGELLSPAAEAERHARAGELAAKGVPAETALWLASLPALRGVPDAVLIAERSGRTIGEAAATLFAVSDSLGLDPLREAARALPLTDYYERLALERALDQIGAAERALAVEVARQGAGAPAVEAWSATRPDVLRARDTAREIAGSGLTLAKLTVAASLLADLARG